MKYIHKKNKRYITVTACFICFFSLSNTSTSQQLETETINHNGLEQKLEKVLKNQSLTGSIIGGVITAASSATPSGAFLGALIGGLIGKWNANKKPEYIDTSAQAQGDLFLNLLDSGQQIAEFDEDITIPFASELDEELSIPGTQQEILYSANDIINCNDRKLRNSMACFYYMD